MTPPQTALAHALPRVAPVPQPSRPVRRPDADRIIADLHERHGAELLRFCRWMLKDADDAADALQDTWIRALSALSDSLVQVVAYRAWLFSIARNVCLDHLRSRQRSSLHELDESSAGSTPGADEVVAIRQEADAALALVGGLSERQRAALLMRELAGMTIAEIAEALNVTPQRAQWAIDDARRALEESRAGSSLACDDARVRIGSGHRNRALKSHLDGCAACRTHDRRMRARRVLAPAFLPFLWIKRIAWPLASLPAAAATVAAVSLPIAGPVGLPERPAPRAAVAPATAAAQAPVVSRRAALPSAPARSVAKPVGPAVAGSSAAPGPVTTPAPIVERPAPDGAPTASVAPRKPPVEAVVEPLVASVHRTVSTAATVAAAVPVAGPVVDQVTETATALLP